jgi:hypothetical protein
MSEFESLRAEYVCIRLNRENPVLERFEDWCRWVVGTIVIAFLVKVLADELA